MKEKTTGMSIFLFLGDCGICSGILENEDLGCHYRVRLSLFKFIHCIYIYIYFVCSQTDDLLIEPKN